VRTLIVQCKEQYLKDLPLHIVQSIYDKNSRTEIKYQSKYGTKSCNYVSSSEKVDDIKVPVKTVESNALDDLLDSVVSPSSHEDQGPVRKKVAMDILRIKYIF
jgi:hypothetical protein